MLQDDWRPGRGSIKCCAPALAGLLAAAKAVKRGEVAIRKGHVQAFHSISIFKQTGSDAFFDLQGNVAIKRGEVSEPIAFLASAADYLVELSEDFINGLCRHERLKRDPSFVLSCL